jgi:hypothetical protein
MTTAGDTVARLTTKVYKQADIFAQATTELFLALDEERPVDPPTMIPQTRQAIATMRRVLDEAEQTLDAIEK